MTSSPGSMMRVARENVPARIDVASALARQTTNFGDTTGPARLML
jgi:hypothetical protein